MDAKFLLPGAALSAAESRERFEKIRQRTAERLADYARGIYAMEAHWTCALARGARHRVQGDGFCETRTPGPRL